MRTRIFLMISAITIFSLTSCNKETDIDQTSTDLAADDAVSDAIFEDVFNTVDNADIILDNYQKGGSEKSMVVSDSCPSVTIDHPSDTKWPKTITVDFGTLCTGLYDNTRSGKIITVVTGPRLTSGSKKTVTFDNYYVNGIKVEGTKVIENIGYNNNQNMVFSVTLTNGKLTMPDGRTIQRSFSREREWIAGLLTRNIWDDECFITGTANGVNIKGVSFSNTITTALYWKRACRFIVSGVVKIERTGFEPVTLNYGEGECDAYATLTMGDKSKEIILKYHR
ncbi:MAG: hypothetical protein NT092_06990 [Bacteroidia bacterium]|nr:hypothetical protein [Bacteroidia bacterium]